MARKPNDPDARVLDCVRRINPGLYASFVEKGREALSDPEELISAVRQCGEAGLVAELQMTLADALATPKKTPSPTTKKGKKGDTVKDTSEEGSKP